MRGEQSRGRATPSDRFFYRRCVVVVTQAEADFRFGLSPEGAQARGEADRPLAQAEGEGGGGERERRNKNFCDPLLVHLKRSPGSAFFMSSS